MTELRRQAFARHLELSWPHPSDDIWRRTEVSLLDPSRGFAPAQPSLLQPLRLSDASLARDTQPLGGEQLIVRANGGWLTDTLPTMITLQELAAAARQRPEQVRSLLEADGFTPAEQKLTSLNAAFHHDDLWLEIPAGSASPTLLRLVHLFSAAPRQAIFPLTIIRVGAGSAVTLLDEYVSVEPTGTTEPHLINSRIELILEPGADVRYVRLQRWGLHAREFLLQRTTLGRGASLVMVNLTLGSIVSKAHLVTRLIGEQASLRLYGFIFGHHRQHVDQHTLQDHHAPHTHSDLLLNAALQDGSRMVYTGLIRIAKPAQQTQAYQANHNLLLSSAAQAETIPMLEILADDVQCKHGASVGPIDEEQTFYLQSRGLPREVAERLIVMGFVEPVIQHIPFEPLQERLRREIQEELH